MSQPTVTAERKTIHGSQYWYLIVRRDGRKKSRYLGKVTAGRASQAAERLRADIETGLDPFAASSTFDEWRGKFLEYAKPRWAFNTWKGLRADTGNFLRWLETQPRVRTPADVTRRVIVEYQSHRLKTAGHRTVNKALAYLSMLFDWSSAEGYSTGNPVKGVKKLSEAEPEVVAATREQIAAVLTHLSPLHRLALLLQYAVGLRPSELCRLRWRDIDFERGLVRVANMKWARTKTRKGRAVALGSLLPALHEAGAAVAVLHWLAGEPTPEHVFCNRANPPGALTPETWTDALYAAADAAHVPRFGAYAVRHSSGTHLSDRDVPVSDIQRRLGHSNLTTTMRYLHPGARDAQATDALEIGDFLAIAAPLKNAPKNSGESPTR